MQDLEDVRRSIGQVAVTYGGVSVQRSLPGIGASPLLAHVGPQAATLGQEGEPLDDGVLALGALMVFHHMRESRVPADRVTFTTLVSGLGNCLPPLTA